MPLASACQSATARVCLPISSTIAKLVMRSVSLTEVQHDPGPLAPVVQLEPHVFP